MRYFALVATFMVALVAVPTAAAPALEPTSSISTPGKVYEKTCSAKEFRGYARAVYRRTTISKAAVRRLDKLRDCLKPWALRYQRKLGRSRFKREHPWEYQRSKIPAWGRAMLERLGGCETRGIPFPKNYQWNGHHHGRYQYDGATWKEAGGQTDFAYQASPAQQDVITFRFYPSHRSRWACSA